MLGLTECLNPIQQQVWIADVCIVSDHQPPFIECFNRIGRLRAITNDCFVAAKLERARPERRAALENSDGRVWVVSERKAAQPKRQLHRRQTTFKSRCRRTPAGHCRPLANGSFGATQRGPSIDAESLGLISTRARACAAAWNDIRHHKSSGLRRSRPARRLPTGVRRRRRRPPLHAYLHPRATRREFRRVVRDLPLTQPDCAA